MSSTRKAKDDSIFHQNRYASSPEFERGLNAALVAKRCSVLSNKIDRELIWFVHLLSHAPGGLEKFSLDLVGRGEQFTHYLRELCLNPECEVRDGMARFMNCPSLVSQVRKYQSAYIKTHTPAFTTALGLKIEEVLDYTLFSRGLSLMEGGARIGKSFAGKNWCEKNPGRSRFIEVPPGNDEIGFFRALARGLGLGNVSQYKACDLKDRVESVLLSGDLILVLDEAQRLWPQRNLRYGFPGRIVWIMSMANAGVPIAMISTPQFITTQKAVEKNGWNSAQLTGRIKHYEPLPSELSHEDLMGVARTVLPEAEARVLKALAIYARNSARYLAAIDSISARARYLAMKDGRDTVTTGDVQRAMNESVIPADSRLQAALDLARNTRRQSLRSPGETAPVERCAQDAADLSKPGTRQKLDRIAPVSAPVLTS